MLDVQRAAPWLALFAACYQVRSNGAGAVWFERVALPAAGGVLEQPAKELMVLEHLEAVATELLVARIERTRAEKAERTDGR